jgi:hypothetical protein
MNNWIATIGILAALLFGGAAVAHPPISQATLAGTADLIVVGKVTAVQETPGIMKKTPKSTSLTAGRGRATITIEQTLKGPALKTAVITYLTPPKERRMDGCFNLKVGARHLFILAGEPREYQVMRDPRAVQEAAAFRTLIAGLPAVTLTVPAVLTFNPTEAVTIRITNRAAKAIVIETQRLRVYGSFGAGEELGITLLPVNAAKPTPMTLKPGETATFAFSVAATLPPQLILAQARITALVTYCTADARKDSAHDDVKSPSVTTVISPHEPLIGAPVNTYQGYL